MESLPLPKGTCLEAQVLTQIAIGDTVELAASHGVDFEQAVQALVAASAALRLLSTCVFLIKQECVLSEGQVCPLSASMDSIRGVQQPE